MDNLISIEESSPSPDFLSFQMPRQRHDMTHSSVFYVDGLSQFNRRQGIHQTVSLFKHVRLLQLDGR